MLKRGFFIPNLEVSMRQVSTVKRTPAKPRTPKNRVETPLFQTTYSNGNFYQKVQETAYQLYIARGCAHGYDVEDWLAAEEIVKGS
jgi:hypothetical protein